MIAAPTILVIDDHEMLARAFAMALEREGYDVHTAYTAEHGLRLAKSEHPAAIILDLQMPFINGAGFLYRLRTSPEHSQTPVMVVTVVSEKQGRAGGPPGRDPIQAPGDHRTADRGTRPPDPGCLISPA